MSIGRYLKITVPLIFAGVLWTLALTKSEPDHLRIIINLAIIWAAVAAWFFVIRFLVTDWFRTSLGRTFMWLILLHAVVFTYVITARLWPDYTPRPWIALTIYTAAALILTKLSELLWEGVGGMIPQISRNVLYVSNEVDAPPRAAIITAVNEKIVDLVVFTPVGMYYVQSIPFSDYLAPGHWTWPK